jgi:hypothetical protein
MPQDPARVWFVQRRLTRRRFLAGAGVARRVALSCMHGALRRRRPTPTATHRLPAAGTRTLVVAVDTLVENLDPRPTSNGRTASSRSTTRC